MKKLQLLVVTYDAHGHGKSEPLNTEDRCVCMCVCVCVCVCSLRYAVNGRSCCFSVLQCCDACIT